MIIGFGRKKQRWMDCLLSCLLIKEEEVQESPKKLFPSKRWVLWKSSFSSARHTYGPLLSGSDSWELECEKWAPSSSLDATTLLSGIQDFAQTLINNCWCWCSTFSDLESKIYSSLEFMEESFAEPLISVSSLPSCRIRSTLEPTSRSRACKLGNTEEIHSRFSEVHCTICCKGWKVSRGTKVQTWSSLVTNTHWEQDLGQPDRTVGGRTDGRLRRRTVGRFHRTHKMQHHSCTPFALLLLHILSDNNTISFHLVLALELLRANSEPSSFCCQIIMGLSKWIVMYDANNVLVHINIKILISM